MKFLEHSIIPNIDCPGPGIVRSINPATEVLIPQCSSLDAAGATDAVSAAAEAYPAWAATPVPQRLQCVDRRLEIMPEEQEELSGLASTRRITERVRKTTPAAKLKKLL